MAIRRSESSFIIGFESLRQQIELAEQTDEAKKNIEKEEKGHKKGVDKSVKGKEKSMTAVKDTKAFRDMTEHFH